MIERIDLGHGVSYSKFQWSPDRDLNPQYEGIPDIEWAGITVYFESGTDNECAGGVTFDSMAAAGHKGPMWKVESYDPLTLSPSIACRTHSHHHGFIQSGRWVPAG